MRNNLGVNAIEPLVSLCSASDGEAEAEHTKKLGEIFTNNRIAALMSKWDEGMPEVNEATQELHQVLWEVLG